MTIPAADYESKRWRVTQFSEFSISSAAIYVCRYTSQGQFDTAIHNDAVSIYSSTAQCRRNFDRRTGRSVWIEFVVLGHAAFVEVIINQACRGGSAKVIVPKSRAANQSSRGPRSLRLSLVKKFLMALHDCPRYRRSDHLSFGPIFFAASLSSVSPPRQLCPKQTVQSFPSNINRQ